MPDHDPRADPRSRAQVPPSNGRPVRKDEIELARPRPVHRVVAARAAIAAQAAPVRPRRAGRLVGSGSGTSATSPAAAGRATRSTCATTTGPRPPTLPSSRSTPTSRTSWPRWTASGRRPSSIGHGMGGLLALKAAERVPSAASSCIAPELPRDLREPARPHVLREIPERLRPQLHRLGDAAREAAARPPRPDARRRAADPAPHGPEAARVGRARRADARRRAGRPRDARRGAAAGHRRRPRSRRSGSTSASAWRSGSAPTTSRSARIRTTASSSARRATSRSPSRDPGVPRGQPALAQPARRGVPGRSAWYPPAGRAAPSAASAPHSSRGPGHRPLKAEITGSNPVCGTNVASPAPGPRPGGFFMPATPGRPDRGDTAPMEPVFRSASIVRRRFRDPEREDSRLDRSPRHRWDSA